MIRDDVGSFRSWGDTNTFEIITPQSTTSSESTTTSTTSNSTPGLRMISLVIFLGIIMLYHKRQK